MKRIQKWCFVAVLFFTVGIWTALPVEAYASTGIMLFGMETCADIIEWRYKIEDGKLYWKQYNYSKKKWTGDWKFVGYVS